GGGIVYPTVAQTAGIIRAFGVTPNELYADVGWWKPKAKRDELTGEEEEAVVLLRELPPVLRNVALNQLRALRDSEIPAWYRFTGPHIQPVERVADPDDPFSGPGVLDIQQEPGEPVAAHEGETVEGQWTEDDSQETQEE